MNQNAPGLILAAPASGQGKTTATLGLLRAFRHTGRRVAAAKAGPDFIDPGFHAMASGRPSVNLDDWAMRDATLARSVAAASDDADLILCEGVMGLFDGAPAGGGSTADIAARTGWPVILIVDVSAQGQSVAATIQGFADWRPDVAISGCILNRIGGPGHLRLAAEAIARTGVPVLGGLPHLPDITLPERHLGLVQARELHEIDALIDGLGAHVQRAVDLNALAALARPTSLVAGEAAPIPPVGQRIAVADDAAFAFSYPHLLAGWRADGAEILPFSPLTDHAPDPTADAIYLPGGYPELHAGRLAGASGFLTGLRAAVEAGAFIYGECGGYMVLGDGLVDADGDRHAMAGLLPVTTSFAEPSLTIGYRRARLLADMPLGQAGAEFRAHEFHQSTLISEPTGEGALFEAGDDRGETIRLVGARLRNVAGSYLHLIDKSA